MTRWRLFFAFAAVWNLLAGLPGLIDPQGSLVRFGLSLPAAADPLIRMIGFIVATFGVGYALVARDPRANRGIVVVGVIGKLGTFAIFAESWARGGGSGTLAAMGAGDLLFAIAFLIFLWKSGQASAPLTER